MSTGAEKPHLSAHTHDILETAERWFGPIYTTLTRPFNDSVSESFQHVFYQRLHGIDPEDIVTAKVPGDPDASFFQRKWKAALFGVDVAFCRAIRKEYPDAKQLIGFLASGVVRAAVVPRASFGFKGNHGLETWSQRQGKGPLEAFTAFWLPNGTIQVPEEIHVLDQLVPPEDFAHRHPESPMF